jgi:23S rRNA pseudouridine1911/1915/1917 synthase
MKIPQKNTQTKSPVQMPDQRDYSANVKLGLTVPADKGGLRLDQILAHLLPQHSRNRLQGWIRDGRVEIGAQAVTEPRQKLWGGEKIAVAIAPDQRSESSAPENIPLVIVHEDDTLLILDKPPGLVVHPGSGNWSGTLLNALLHYAPLLDQVPRAGIVHRLDKDTSGLMVVAKTLEAQTDLVRQMQARTVKRYYQALVRGHVEGGGTVDAPIGRHPTQRTKMAVVKTGKSARTHYRVVERFIDCTLIECALETGRTHQIRVHMTSIGHPLVGDLVYSGGTSRVPKGPVFDRQALHARRLGLVHPTTGKAMLWKSPLPEALAELIETLRSEAFEARALEEEDDWDEDLEGGPEIIYAYGDGTDSSNIEDSEDECDECDE